MSEELMTKKPKSKNTKKTQTELEKELHAMKKELVFRQKGIDILKKAAPYFAKNKK